MIGCPNCGNKLVFDVDSQKMKCRYCDATYLISEASKWSKDALEYSEDDGQGMEITTFTCTQCGAEISADSDEAVTWCSFCGSPTTLVSRLTRIRRPDCVIPFRRNRQSCADEYKKIARKQIYAPRDLLRRGNAEGFRGIYMPYWTYDIKRSGSVDFHGEVTEHYNSESDCVTKYRVQGNLTSYVSGLSHDASQTFDDYVSERIAPYMLSNQKPFDVCYLNGFYANAADQDDKVYRNRVIGEESELIFNYADTKFHSCGLKESSVLSNLAVEGYGAGFLDGAWREIREDDVSNEQDRDEHFGVVTDDNGMSRKMSIKGRLAMFPVWFMSYRWGNRVSYATMNGDTGKMYAEFPASPKRFLAFSALTAIPLFALIYLFYTLTPSYVLFLALMAAIGASGMFKSEVVEIFKKQFHINTEYGKKKNGSGKFWTIVVIISLIFIPFVELWFEANLGFQFRWLYLIIAIIALGVFIVRFFKMRNTYGGIVDVHMDATNLWYIAIAIAAGVIFYFNPASDAIYYALSLGTVAVVGLSVTELIRSYNILSSVKPKQFNRSGGDDDNA